MKLITLVAIASVAFSNVAQAESIKCFGAVNDGDVAAFVEDSVIDTATSKSAITSTSESADYRIEARRRESASSLSLTITDKKTGVSARGIGWPKADVTLSVPTSTGGADKIEAVCTYTP